MSDVPAWHPGIAWPTGWTGVVTAGSDEDEQHEQLHPDFWGLVSVNKAGNPAAGTPVFDLEESGVPGRWARLQSLVAVVGFEAADVLALQLGRGGRLDGDGGGLVLVDYDDNEVAFGSYHGLGPFTTGGKFGCKHDLGRDADGRPVRPLHLTTGSLIIAPWGADGPWAFEPAPYPLDAEDLAHPVHGHIRFDGQEWRVHTTSALYTPAQGGGGGGTQVRGGRGGPGGGPGGGGPGGPGGGGPPPGSGGLPPSTANLILTPGAFVRELETLTGRNFNTGPVTGDLNTSGSNATGDGAGLVGGGIFGGVGGIIDDANIGAVGAAGIPYGQLANGGTPLVGSDYKPAFAHSSQQLVAPCLTFKGTATQTGETDLSGARSPTPAEVARYDDAPLSGQLVGFAKGDGTWAGFGSYQQNDQQGHAMAAGGFMVIPPDVTASQVIAGTAVTQAQAYLALPPQLAQLAFATPDISTGQAKSGVVLRGDGSTIQADVVNSTGAVTDTVDLLERVEVLDDLADVNAPTPNTGDVLTRSGGEWVAAAPVTQNGVYPRDWIDGLLVVGNDYGSGYVKVTPGRAMDSTNAVLFTQLGLNRDVFQFPSRVQTATLSGTFSNSGPASSDVIGSGSSLLTQLSPNATPRSLPSFSVINTIGTGGVSSVNLVGNDTFFTRDVHVGDLIGPAAGPLTRVVSIEDDFNLTLAVAVTIADGTAAVVVENPILTMGGETRRVNQVTSNTAATVTPAWTGGITGQAGTVGGALSGAFYGCFFMQGSTSWTIKLSSQYTTPFPTSGYSDYFRRIGFVRASSTSTVYKTFQQSGGCNQKRETLYDPGDGFTLSTHPGTILDAGTATAWTQVGLGAACPPLTRGVKLTIKNIDAAETIYFRPRCAEDVHGSGLLGGGAVLPGNSVTLDLPVNGHAGIEYAYSGAPAGYGAIAMVVGWSENPC